jgi:hypothetical protein
MELAKKRTTFLTQPIDIDIVTWSHLVDHAGAAVSYSENEIWFDISTPELEGLILTLRSRDLDWHYEFVSQLLEVAPNLREADAYRFVSDRHLIKPLPVLPIDGEAF